MSLKSKFKEILIRASSVLLPLFQYIPTASIYHGIMSIPLIFYIISMLTYNPKILFYDFLFFFPENVLALLGFFLFLYSLIYLYRKRNGLVKTGPYKYVRHPQYLGIIMMTFGLTLVSLQTYPVIPYLLTPLYIGHLAVLLVWTVEVFAYVMLAKLEESYLRSKFGDEYVKYSESVPFIIPLRLKSDTKK